MTKPATITAAGAKTYRCPHSHQPSAIIVDAIGYFIEKYESKVGLGWINLGGDFPEENNKDVTKRNGQSLEIPTRLGFESLISEISPKRYIAGERDKWTYFCAIFR